VSTALNARHAEGGCVNTAHETQVTGRYSELLAQTALLAAGYEVSEPIAPEVYDLVTRNPVTGEYMRVQCKTARVREDREGAIVVYARKGSGEPYTPEECDAIIGVNGNDVYMFPCAGHSEYWATPGNADTKWTLLPSVRRS
jgi:hypothetical protein